MTARVAIVTGASRGIGRATAIRLAQDFGMVVIVARDPVTLGQTAAQISAAGAEPLALDGDLRDAAMIEHVIGATLARFRRIDALVNIAGAVPQGDLFALSDAEWADGLALKFHAARRLTIAAWDALKASRGSVVITSGTSAITPKASIGAVSTINAAILAMAKAFAERGLVDGVQVNTVLPGPVLTDRRRAMLQNYADAHALPIDAAMTRFAAESGITRYGESEDIAAAVAFLVSPPARWMTGATLRIDGGETKAI